MSEQKKEKRTWVDRLVETEYVEHAGHIVRVMFGVFLGVGVTLWYSLYGALLVALGKRRRANRLIGIWGRVVSRIMEQVIGERAILYEFPQELDPERPIVIYGEHFKYHEVGPFMKFVSELAGQRMLIPVARGQRGILAPALRAMSAIIIDRKNGDEAVSKIREVISAHGSVDKCFMIFPTGTRGDRLSRAEARAYFERMDAEERPVDLETIYRITERTDVPRWRGFQTLRSGVDHLNPQYVRVCIATVNGAENISQYLTRRPMGIFYSFRLVSEPPASKEEMINDFDRTIADFKKKTQIA